MKMKGQLNVKTTAEYIATVEDAPLATRRLPAGPER
jgi:hypothetical protein